METTTLRRNNLGKTAKIAEVPVRKSRIAIFWERNPKGIIKVLDRRAVNK